MYQDCVETVYRYFAKSSPLPTYFTVRDRSLFIIPKGGLGPVERMFAGGGKNCSYATGLSSKFVVKVSLNSQLRITCVATLPCKICINVRKKP